MNTDTTNLIIAKVQKLMATAADSGATEHEAATALRLADALMARHRITEQMIARAAADASRPAGVQAEDLTTRTVFVPPTKKVSAAASWITMAVGALCGYRTYRSWRVRHDRQCIVGYGLPTDLAIGAELSQELYSGMQAALAAFCAEWQVRKNSREANSFAAGYSTTLLKRARRAAREAERTAETIEVALPAAKGAEPSRALVCLGEERQSLERALAVKQKQLGIGKGRASSFGSGSMTARTAGANAASSVSLSTRGVR